MNTGVKNIVAILNGQQKRLEQAMIDAAIKDSESTSMLNVILEHCNMFNFGKEDKITERKAGK